MPTTHNKTQNWFQTAFNQVPKGQVNSKIEEILTACNISQATFYNWKKSGEVPNEITKNAILGILAQKMENQTAIPNQ